MKTSNLISAALLALGIAAQASAQQIVYLTGSTAFRSTVYAALSDENGTNAGGVFDTNSVTWTTWGNASASGAPYMVFKGTISGSPVYIDCAWSGSEAGIASACNTSLGNFDRNGNNIALAGSPEEWLSITNLTFAGGPNGNIVSTNPGPNDLEGSTHGADLSQSDTSQAISWTPFVANTQTALKDYGVEAIVTFTLSRNANPFPSNEWKDVSNVTLPQLNVLLANGWEPAGFFSGNPTDDDFTVYLVGRNLGSGTRMNMLGDSQYGAHKVVKQYSIGFGIEAPQNTHVDSLVLTNEGDNGYESGGDVAKALGIINTNNGTGSCQQADPFHGGNGWFALGYVAPSDALNTANFGGAPTNNWVTVDGVLSSDGAIENGSWWLWGHEHLYGKYQNSGVPDSVGFLVESAVQQQINILGYGTNAVAHDPGIPVGLMNATKGSDVAYPTPNF